MRLQSHLRHVFGFFFNEVLETITLPYYSVSKMVIFVTCQNPVVSRILWFFFSIGFLHRTFLACLQSHLKHVFGTFKLVPEQTILLYLGFAKWSFWPHPVISRILGVFSSPFCVQHSNASQESFKPCFWHFGTNSVTEQTILPQYCLCKTVILATFQNPFIS